MRENFLITTGGSGGHVIPATILYEHLSKDANIIISTDKRGLKYFDKNIYQFEIINTPKFNNIFFLPINLLITLFLIQQFIYTGCFFFPTNFCSSREGSSPESAFWAAPKEMSKGTKMSTSRGSSPAGTPKSEASRKMKDRRGACQPSRNSLRRLTSLGRTP